jgi:branched-chain amino acid transport system ATP-binding protein
VTNLLEVRDASLSFGGLQALAGVSLDVSAGSIVGLIGPNGAGKTTTFNSISGLQALDAGSIHFQGQDVTGLAAHQRAALGIGRSFQHLGAGYGVLDPVLRPWRWMRRERALAARVEEALEVFGLGDDRDRSVRDLSFAAARSVELAAVLVEEPSLMLLDEPTTGLDVAEVEALRQVLLRVRDDGTTILVIAHDVAFVMGLCDHVYVLARGAVLAAGPPEQVQRDPAVVEAYLGAVA